MEIASNNNALLVQHNDASTGLVNSTPGDASAVIGTHIVAAGNFKVACDSLKEWLLKSGLKREQLVAISASETTTVDGEAVLSVVYRKG